MNLYLRPAASTLPVCRHLWWEKTLSCLQKHKNMGKLIPINRRRRHLRCRYRYDSLSTEAFTIHILYKLPVFLPTAELHLELLTLSKCKTKSWLFCCCFYHTDSLTECFRRDKVIIKKKSVSMRHEDDPVMPLGDVHCQVKWRAEGNVVRTGKLLQSASDGKPVVSSTDTSFI